MKLVVLPQVLHGGEIHAVDVNSSNEFAVTGGLDSVVYIWRVEDLTALTTADKATLLKIAPQKTLDFSTSTVKVALWSPTNKDVLIVGNAAGQIQFCNAATETTELIFPWPSIKDTYIASVIDGSWSADGKLFAWSTSDGKVHVLDVEKRTHQELISSSTDKITVQRSIAFDPTNNYFVCIGDDTLVHIYQFQYDTTSNYQFKVLAKSYKLVSDNVTIALGIDYRRISWSCDGEYVSVPNANKQLTSLISLLSRSQGWENAISLVGHDMESDVVKFGPHMFQVKPAVLDPEKKDQHHVYHMIASAGSDKTLVLWNTSKETPVFVLRDITSKPVVDLTWDRTGKYLIVVTLDGHIVMVSFEDGELGDVVSPQLLDQLKQTQKQQAKPFASKTNTESDASGSKKSKQASEIVDQKQATNIKDAFEKKEEQKPDPKKATEVTEDKSANQVEEETPLVGDITPIVIVPGSSVDQDMDDILLSAMEERSNASESTAISNEAKVPKKVHAKSAITESPAKQKVTTKDGKKRIQPTLLSNGNGRPIVPSHDRATSSTIGGVKTSRSLMEFERPSLTVSDEVQKENKRARAPDENGVTKKLKRDLDPVKFVGSVVLNPSTAFAKIRLSVPKIRHSFRVSSRSDSFVLDIKNGQGNEAAPSRITYFKNDLQVWSDFIPRYLQLATEGKTFWAISTIDGQILTYSHLSGKRLLPPIILGSPLSFLESHGDFLLAVTSVAEIFIWNMEKKKLHMHSPLSLASLLELNNKFQEDTLSKSDNITMCSITSSGIPLVTLSNGSGYLYNNDMGVWQTVTEAWWAFGSHYWDSIADDKSSELKSSQLVGRLEESSLLGLLEHKTNEELLRKGRVGRGKYFNKISKNMIMKEGFENLENTISLSHLENRILCCELLGENRDFKDFLITYVKRICELGLKAKLFEVCQQLLAANGPDDTICDLNKRELLKEVILACTEYRDAQRILVRFGKELGMIEGEY